MVFADEIGLNNALGKICAIECRDIKQGHAKLVGGDFGQVMAVDILLLNQILHKGNMLGASFFLRIYRSFCGYQALGHQSAGQTAELPYRCIVHLPLITG